VVRSGAAGEDDSLPAGRRCGAWGRDKNGPTALPPSGAARAARRPWSVLLEAGATRRRGIRSAAGATPFHLAVQNTARGSGDAAAKSAQRRIIELSWRGG